MENNAVYKQATHNIKKLEEKLASIGDAVIEKSGVEAERDIEEHFGRCLTALADRKDVLLKKVKEVVQSQSMFFCIFGLAIVSHTFPKLGGDRPN